MYLQHITLNTLIKQILITSCRRDSVICGPLSKLFQNSIDRGEYPESWKQACVSALHKKGSVHDCNNYRPISLLSCISKVFEKLVFKHIYTYLTRHNLINPHQSGFRPSDSTVKQLISICHRISKSLDNGEEVLSVFIDFRKAFDKVWHKGLLFKLDKIGIKVSAISELGSHRDLYWVHCYSLFTSMTYVVIY